MAESKKPKVPKGAPRPFWIQGYEGWTEPDGEFFVSERVITGGNKRTTGGYNLNLYQRVSADPRGVVVGFQVEARATLDGWLTTKVWLMSGGRRQGKPMIVRTHRDGIPMEAVQEDDTK